MPQERAAWRELLLLALLLCSHVGYTIEAAANDEFLHRVWTREQGLPDNRVQAILQTKDGYLWIATASGLARFDGLQFAAFTQANTPALESEDCFALAEDSAGVLWVGTGAGVLRRTPLGFERVQIDGLDRRDLRLLGAGRQTGAWLTPKDGDRLYHLEGQRVLWSLPPEPAKDGGEITGVSELNDGQLWIAHAQDVLWLDCTSGRAQPVRNTPSVSRPWLHRAV